MMRRFTLTSSRRPRTPMIDEDGGEGDSRGGPQGTLTKSSEGTVDLKHFVRQRLDKSPGFRIRSSTIKFTSGNTCGSGGKADVVQATFRRWYSIKGQLVAVKQLRSIHTKKACNEFIHEVEVMTGLSHKNVVRFIGFVEELQNGKAWIVLSWEPNGNVSEFLAKGEWEIPERVSLIQDTFEGIKYLHTRQPPICHGDLKSLNILVSSEYRAVITDFGSARAIHTPEDVAIGGQSRQQAQGPSTAEQANTPIRVNAADNQLTLTGPAWSLRWAAPEVVNGERPALSSDIWAAGWICWELMTDNVPFPELNAAGVITLTVTQGEVPSPREEGQLGQIVALCSLMTDCWAYDPKVRPTISRCCKELHWMPSTPPSGANSSGSKVLSADLLCQMGQMNYEQDNYEKAALLFQEALSLARSVGNQTATAVALEWLGDVYVIQLKHTQAEESYTRAQEIYARIGHDLGQAKTLLGLGQVYGFQSKYTEAEESYIRAHEISARIGDDLGQANTLFVLGNVYREQSRFTEAEWSYARAEEIFASIGADLGRANALFGQGDVYRSQAKYTEAEELFTRAQEIYARIGADLGQTNALFGLGEVYRFRSKYTEAEESYTRAQEIGARLGNDLGRANALNGLGDVYREQSKYAEAEASYTRAQEIYASIGNDLGRANALRGLGHLRRKQGNNAGAVSPYTQAGELYMQLGRPWDAYRCLELARQGVSD